MKILKHSIITSLILIITFFLLSDFSRKPHCYPWTNRIICNYNRARYDRNIADERYNIAEGRNEKIREFETQIVVTDRKKLQEQSERNNIIMEIVSQYPESPKYLDNQNMNLSYEELENFVRKLHKSVRDKAFTEAERRANIYKKTSKEIMDMAIKTDADRLLGR